MSKTHIAARSCPSYVDQDRKNTHYNKKKIRYGVAKKLVDDSSLLKDRGDKLSSVKYYDRKAKWRRKFYGSTKVGMKLILAPICARCLHGTQLLRYS